MNLDQIISAFAVYALPVIFAITLHEAAHAYAAKYFGDTTAFDAGRMSLNPLRHIDPFGTIALPIITFAVSYAFAPFVFGYAKPVPVEFSRLRKPKQQMAWVALAGPAANFFMALGWLVMLLVLRGSGVAEAFPHKVAQAGVFVNLILFAINLLPIPPLDGGRMLTSWLPNRLAYKFAQLERFGFFIVIALLVTGLMQYWMDPVMGLTLRLLDLLVTPLKLLIN
jgi:Zn-dependent protease